MSQQQVEASQCPGEGRQRASRAPLGVQTGWLLASLTALVALLGCSGPQAPAARAPAVTESGVPRIPSTAVSMTPRVLKLKRPGWVEVSASVLASETEAPAQARERALAMARRAAIEFVAGVRVRSSLVSFEGMRGADASSLVQSLTVSRADALVLDEELRSSRLSPVPGGGYRVTVVMRARVLDRSKGSDPDFRIQIELGRERFLAGEEVSLAVRASRKSRIYVLGISEEGASVLLPNRWLMDTRARAGEWLRFPDAELRERGVRLVAQVPDGRRSAKEALVVVALRGERTLDGLIPASGKVFRDSDADGAGGLLAELLTPLSELPSDAWAFEQVVYEVLAR